jgi:phage shock protein PspC (stress-responsive transcriptional regulator)
MLDAMTTTDHFPLPTQPTRTLRRSSSDRVAAGVAGGLGEYFRIDPVLFRVLFAATAFFGGAGVVAYVIAWAAIPERGADNAPIDRFARELRRRHVPLWLVASAAVVAAWALLFSWWAPWPFAPVVIAVVILVAVLRRRPAPAAASWAGAATPSATPSDIAGVPMETAPSGQNSWLPETRAWIAESRERRQVRRGRSAPVRRATRIALLLAIASLAVADGLRGIVLPAYFWAIGGIVLVGLLVGAILRRPTWSLATLLVPVVLGLLAFGGTHASLHDGSGERTWTPTAAAGLGGDYRLAFGRAVLDLTGLPALDRPQQTTITMAAGQLRIVVPAQMNLIVHAHVNIGSVNVDGSVHQRGVPDSQNAGLFVTRDIAAPADATGSPLTIDVRMSDGDIRIDHVG